MSGGLKGLVPRTAWLDEGAVFVDFETRGRKTGKTWAAAGVAAHEAAESMRAVYADSLSALQRELLEELTRAKGLVRETGRAADALAGIFSQAASTMEEELHVGGGVAWSSIEARTWAREKIPGVRSDEETVGVFWHGEKTVPGGVGGFGRGGRRTPSVASPRMRRWRIGDSVYAWVPEGLDAGRSVTEASRRPRQAVPGEVLDAERRIGAADAAAGEFVRLMERLGHAGEVLLPADNGGDWECRSCGAVTSDEELFGEMRCGGA